MRAAYSASILTLILVSLPGMADEGDEEREDTRGPAGAIDLPQTHAARTRGTAAFDTKLPATGVSKLSTRPASAEALTDAAVRALYQAQGYSIPWS
jgi:hypothetical protein